MRWFLLKREVVHILRLTIVMTKTKIRVSSISFSETSPLVHIYVVIL